MNLFLTATMDQRVNQFNCSLPNANKNCMLVVHCCKSVFTKAEWEPCFHLQHQPCCLDGLGRSFGITKCLLNYKPSENPSVLPQISIPTTMKSGCSMN